eukprot:3934061-Prymnesium_polylepis.1
MLASRRSLFGRCCTGADREVEDPANADASSKQSRLAGPEPSKPADQNGASSSNLTDTASSSKDPGSPPTTPALEGDDGSSPRSAAVLAVRARRLSARSAEDLSALNMMPAPESYRRPSQPPLRRSSTQRDTSPSRRASWAENVGSYGLGPRDSSLDVDEDEDEDDEPGPSLSAR